MTHPGQFKLREGLRVDGAIATAGGIADFANQKKIAVIRDGQRHDFNYRDFINVIEVP